MKIVLSLLLTAATTAWSQRLPAGTRDANDNSRAYAANAAVRAAEAALERGDLAAAKSQLEVLAADRPRDAHVLYDLGYVNDRLGDEAAARAAYTKSVELDAGDPEPRLALGLLEARSGHFDAARPQFLLVADMGLAPAALRGRALRALAQLDQATDAAAASGFLLRAIELTGADPADTALSAILASKLGDSPDAEAGFRALLAKDPGNADAAVGLAHLLQTSGKAGEAIAVLSPALAAHPGDVRLLSAEASALAAQNKFDEAIALLTPAEASTAPPPDSATRTALDRQLARLDLAANHLDAAETLFRRVLSAQPADAYSLDDLGTTLVREHKYAEAQRVLTMAVAHREKFQNGGDFGDAAGHLAFAASKNNDPRTCLQALALRSTVLPDSPPSLFLQATAFDALHQNKDAIRTYQAFLALAGVGYADEEFEARHRIVALQHVK